MKFFGSSGIRGRFNEAITPEFVCRLGLAAGSLHKNIVVGWDTRTTSPLLGNALVSGLLSAGCNAHVAGMVSTPTLANAAAEFDAGIMITASHNPPTDNGVKFWNPDGSSFDVPQMEKVESILEAGSSSVSWDKVGKIEHINWPVDWHIKKISQLIGKLKGPVVVDCGNGATTNITPQLLRSLGCKVITINGEPDGSFPGRSSEPNAGNTKILAQCVVDSGAILGIAHDGDGDRMVAVDEKGGFAGGDALIPLFSKLEGKEKVVIPINASMAVEKYLKGVKVVRCRVGDVYVAQKIKEVKADFGAEPSGTWIFPRMSLCPDGVFAAARLVQIVQKKPLSEYLAEIPKLNIIKKRIEMKPDKIPGIIEKLKKKLAGLNPIETSEIDGIWAVFKNGWLLFRPSGTEAKLKLVVEGNDEESAEDLYNTAIRLVDEVSD
jgi:phosphoglucosamine mutase